jgi:TRAP-type mannitol/chloroaromatic compound transport system substrate-binding protein
MKERTVLPVAIVCLLLLWVGTLGLWALDSQKKDPVSATRSQVVSTEKIKWKLVTTWPKGLPGLGSAPENLRAVLKK